MKPLFRVAERLQRQLPDDVVIEVGTDDAAGELLPEEVVATAGWAPHRRAQFAIGRTLARRALRRVEHENVSILFGTDGEPVWPSGVVGSISHKRQCCIVIISRSARLRGLGVDLERDGRDPAEPELVRRVCASEREQEQATTLIDTTASPGTLFLAAKEAFFKCQFPITRARLDWDDVDVVFRPPDCFSAQAATFRAEGSYVIAEGWIVAAALENQVITTK